MFPPDARIRRAPDAAFNTVSGTLFILQPRRRWVHELNETGAFIWNAIGKQGATVAEIAAGMRAAFDAPHGEIDADLAEYLHRLAREELIVVEPLSPAPEKA
ncbi:MAG: PqqD family protein [Planctomycetes bacterium]|nr:PqqD family protein [Planctomycetota bacterium]